MNYKIIGKYIKNIVFNIPNPKTFFLLSKEISNYKINIDIKSKQIKKNIIEIVISLNLTPVKENIEKIDTKISYAAIIELTDEKIENENLEKIVLVDVPSQVYTDLRRIFVKLFEDSGFKDVKINENVDFHKLYLTRKVQ